MRWTEDSCKTIKVESYRFTFTVTCRPQSCCSAQTFSSASQVSTEQVRLGVENWLSKSDHAFSSTGKLVAHMNEQLDCQLSPEVVTVITKPLRSHKERFENSPEDIKLIQTVETAGFMPRVYTTPRP